MATLKKAQKWQRYEEYRKEAQVEYATLKQDHLFIIGVAIYWGEGEKTDNGRVSVINTNTHMLQIMVRFYRRVLKVPPQKLRAALYVYADIDKNKTLQYWSEKLNIPSSQFIKTQQLPSRSRLTKRKIKYGICNVYFSSTQMNIKIQEWIKELGDEYAGIV